MTDLSDLSTPSRLGPFELLFEIASGASSVVYAARNTVSRDQVALKVFHSRLVKETGFLDRLQRETETLKQLDHHGIVRLIESWSLESRYFLELEMVSGGNLKHWMRGHGECTWLEPRLWIMTQIARGLGAVHEQGIVHRDLKPENILVAADGRVKLTDFGLARFEQEQFRLTQTGALVGSLAYMSPEVASGSPATQSSDVFSFGVVAYELLCGRHPFFDSDEQLQIKKLLAGEFTPCQLAQPRIPRDLAKLIDQCLNVAPERRPASIWRVETELMEYLQRSEQLSLVREWFRSPTQDTQVRALELTHARLKSEINTAISAGSDRARTLALVNEFRAMFPDDVLNEAWLRLLTVPARKKSSLKINTSKIKFFAFIILLLTATGFFVWKQKQFLQGADKSVENVSEKPVAPADAKPAEKTSTEALISTKVAASKPKMGTLKLMIDPGVRAFVDGRRVGSSELLNYQIAPGRYPLLLEKDGFLPIEKTVVVRPGRVTVVNAKTPDEGGAL
jgi:serine/threonine protein kinase